MDKRIEERLVEIKRLTELKKNIDEKLQRNKELVHEYFENMSQEDFVLCDGQLEHDNVIVKYVPKSTINRVDSKKLKEDGIYDNYVTKTERKSYITVKVLNDE